MSSGFFSSTGGPSFSDPAQSILGSQANSNPKFFNIQPQIINRTGILIGIVGLFILITSAVALGAANDSNSFNRSAASTVLLVTGILTLLTGIFIVYRGNQKLNQKNKGLPAISGLGGAGGLSGFSGAGNSGSLG